MAGRTITVQRSAKISVLNHCLRIAPENDLPFVIPLDDIWVLIIETQRAVITTAALAQIVEAGIGVMTCDAMHMPSGLLLPIGAHSRHAAIVDDQLSISKPLAKRMWQAIVKQKIANQAAVLSILGIDSTAVSRYIPLVLSGDKGNREAHAAQAYFRLLISDGTRRESAYTAALDYGYSVVRAGVARQAVSGGWLVSRGIHHDNDLNAFNLVDDLLEPFRPIVDLMVARDRLYGELTPAKRARLAAIFEQRVFVGGDSYNVQSAIVEELRGLRASVKENDADRMRLPAVQAAEKR